ncbi:MULTISPECIES: DUF2637 domain-containing protein [unclassified Rhodococcus (in: high G+C Gram-positive bacteria)]|uniref:DUF2637 domain-containing protein n=1 Tax=unclassified Rhodococcus (in: high G+C Gram-positive bacteria) TaxID=192944 RepID=UPI0020CEDB1D|nr:MULTISPECIES: DUF2637 domain-containing protein [unclassified Rhodococcus (in: high G+C Gram-positive bacteria)]
MSRLPLIVASAGAVAISAGAFTLSFTALADLAAHHGVPASQTWLFPLVVDATILVATLSVVALRRSRWYAWLLLGLSAGVSLAGNAVHAWQWGPVAVGIATVPPLMLLAVTHLCVLLMADARPRVVDVAEVADAPPMLSVVDAPFRHDVAA